MDQMTEDALSQFAAENETVNTDEVQKTPKKRVVNPELPDSGAAGNYRRADDTQDNMPRETLVEARNRVENEAREYSRNLGAGFVEVPVETLPTQGIFYPEGAKLMIRAASGAEIRHWSTISDDDLSLIDDAINYVLQRCVTIKFPESSGMIATWQDLKEIDRFYLLLAIRDFTFTEGNNELKITVSEGKDIVVHKDNIKFVEIPKRLMKHYNVDERCFVFTNPKLRKPLKIYMPSVGVAQWLKGYVRKKSQRNEGFDNEFIQFAPMLIKDYRSLNDTTYEAYLMNTNMDFGTVEYSLLAKIRQMMSAAITPKMQYMDEDGTEQEAPLNFRGGLQAIFLMDLDDIL